MNEDEGCFFFFVPQRRPSVASIRRAEGTEARPQGCSFYVDPESGTRARVNSVVYLARHASHAEVGRALSGRSEIALSGVGRAEAARLAERLADVPLAAIHASPRARARETAAIVGGRQGLAIQVVEALDEIDFGTWTGRSFAALDPDPRWQAWNARRSETRCPGGESMSEAVGRARRHLESLAGPRPEQAGSDGAERSDGPVLCVTHCDIIRGLVAHYLGLGFDRVMDFDCDPASLTMLALTPGGARLVTLNERMP